MTLPLFGNPISIDDLRTEFGVTGQRSLQDFYAGGGIVSAGTLGFPNGGVGVAIPSSGEISLNNFYGASAAFKLSFASNQQEVNLRSSLISAGWDQNTAVEVTINQGIWITGNTTNAMTIQGPFPNGIRIFLNGIIAGRGGDGHSTYLDVTQTFPTAGKNAIQIENALNVNIIIGTNGYILAGGGGGAAWLGGGGGGAGGGRGGDAASLFNGWAISAASAPSGLSAPIKGSDGPQYVESSTDALGSGGSGGWTFAPNSNGRAYGGGKPGFDDGTGNPQNTSRGGQGGFAGGGGAGWIRTDTPILQNGVNIGFRGGNGGTSYISGSLVSDEGQTGFGETQAYNFAGPAGGGGGWGRKGGDASYPLDSGLWNIRQGALPGLAVSLSLSSVNITGSTGNRAGNIA